MSKKQSLKRLPWAILAVLTCLIAADVCEARPSRGAAGRGAGSRGGFSGSRGSVRYSSRPAPSRSASRTHVSRKPMNTRHRAGNRAGKHHDARRDIYDDYRRRRAIRAVIRLGVRIANRPRGYTTHVYGGSTYYYHGGTFYSAHGGSYVVVAAPTTVIVASVPEECDIVDVQGREYYYCFGTYYTEAPMGYTVVQAPIGATVGYVPEGYRVEYLQQRKYVVYSGVYYEPVMSRGVTVYRVARYY